MCDTSCFQGLGRRDVLDLHINCSMYGRMGPSTLHLRAVMLVEPRVLLSTARTTECHLLLLLLPPPNTEGSKSPRICCVKKCGPDLGPAHLTSLRPLSCRKTVVALSDRPSKESLEASRSIRPRPA